MKTEAHNGKVSCPNCLLHFPPAEIESHYVMCATGCTICKKTFIAPDGLKQHKDNCGTLSKNHCCDICGKRYRLRKGLRNHIRGFHEGITMYDRKPHQCNICKLSFPSYPIMRLHRIKEHLQEDYQRQCQKCGLKFSNPEALKSHLSVHEAPQFKCSFCGKMMKKKSTWESHERAHRGEKPFPCTVCSASFSGRHSLAQHMSGVHKIAGPKGRKVGWGHAKKQKQIDVSS